MDIQIRLARIEDCQALGEILVSSTNGAFSGLVPDTCLEWTADESAANWKRNFKEDGSLSDDNCIFVAETAVSGVVGFALSGEVRSNEAASLPIDPTYENELLVLQVFPDWQRQGIGRLLVSRVAAELLKNDNKQLLVRVLTINPNRPFYERLGAVKLGAEPYDWDGFKTEMSIYGWPDVSKLIVKEGLNG